MKLSIIFKSNNTYFNGPRENQSLTHILKCNLLCSIAYYQFSCVHSDCKI